MKRSILTWLSYLALSSMSLAGAGRVHLVDVNASIISPAVDRMAVSAGDIEGHSAVHKFGDAPDFDTGDGVVTVWDGADDGGVDQMTYVYSSTNNIDSIISTDTGDVVQVEIQGLDINWTQVVQTVTLSGQTRVALTTPLRRVYRMKNVGATDLAGTVSCYVTNAPTSSGVVTDSSLVRAAIDNGNNQTLMAVYTVPEGKTAYVCAWYGAVSGGNKSTNYKMELYARPFGGVFQLKHRSSLEDGGTSSIRFGYDVPVRFAEKTDLEMRASLTAAAVTGAAVAGGFDIILVDN